MKNVVFAVLVVSLIVGGGRGMAQPSAHDDDRVQSGDLPASHPDEAVPAAEPDFEIRTLADSLSLHRQGRGLWTFHHRAEEGKPYVHPLATTGGSVLSGLRPDDHPWHRGLWFSWKLINGVNYWEEDRQTGASEGQTRLHRVERTVLPNQAARIDLALSYAPAATGDPVMEEDRTVVFHPPGGTGAYRIDWSSTFRALDEDVHLDRTPNPGEPDGKSYGGYAGYSLRLSQACLGSTFLNSEGQAGAQAHRQPARWVLCTSSTQGSVLFLDHPDNLRSPAKWYIAESMPYFSPAVIHDGRHTLPAGEALSLRYRLIIYPGIVDQDVAERAWGAWTASQAGPSR